MSVKSNEHTVLEEGLKVGEIAQRMDLSDLRVLRLLPEWTDATS